MYQCNLLSFGILSMSESNCYVRIFFNHFFPCENELFSPVVHKEKKLEHRKWTSSKINIWINMEYKMFQGRYNNNLYKEWQCFTIWKIMKKSKKEKRKNKPKKGNGNNISMLLFKCAASTVTNSSVGIWDQSCKSLMPKEQSGMAGQNQHKLENISDVNFKKLCQGICYITGNIVKWSDFSQNWSA